MTLEEIVKKGMQDREFFKGLVTNIDKTLEGVDPGVIAKVEDMLASRRQLKKWRLKTNMADVEW